MKARRPPVLTPTQVATARRERAEGRPTTAIARDLHVHRSTPYRYLGDERRAERLALALAERAAQRRAADPATKSSTELEEGDQQVWEMVATVPDCSGPSGLATPPELRSIGP